MSRDIRREMGPRRVMVTHHPYREAPGGVAAPLWTSHPAGSSQPTSYVECYVHCIMCYAA